MTHEQWTALGDKVSQGLDAFITAFAICAGVFFPVAAWLIGWAFADDKWPDQHPALAVFFGLGLALLTVGLEIGISVLAEATEIKR
ncbi:hypothetical protein [Amycolatopsis thermoflava]|uniref:hypothetical protein n=1 Tax=Amycolatopsis thermoflava TaxID=84480 RepID=UPI000416B35E|nr:hypothetical protein [Amycolatopsis thermoflava]